MLKNTCKGKGLSEDDGQGVDDFSTTVLYLTVSEPNLNIPVPSFYRPSAVPKQYLNRTSTATVPYHNHSSTEPSIFTTFADRRVNTHVYLFL